MSTATLPPPAAPPASGSRLWRLLRWWMPVFIGALLLGATSFLVNLSSVQERGEANDQLVTDTQWVRQSLQFQLGHDAEALELIGSDLRTGAMALAALEARLRVFLRRGRQSLSASLIEAGQAAPLVDVRDASVEGQDIFATVPPVFIEAAMERAARQSEGTFGQPFTATWGAGLVLVVPAGLSPSGARRTLVAVFSLERLLEEMVPWTFAQSHEVIVSDVTNTVKARRASAGPGRGIYTHQVAVDVPGTTLILRTNSVKGPPDWIANVLRGGVIALAFFLFWSLYALWADVRRRVKAESRLRDEVAFRRAMGDSAVIGLRARDMEGRVTFVNPAFARMVGLPEESIVGRAPPMPYWTPERLDEYQERVARVLSGQASSAPRDGLPASRRHAIPGGDLRRAAHGRGRQAGGLDELDPRRDRGEEGRGARAPAAGAAADGGPPHDDGRDGLLARPRAEPAARRHHQLPHGLDQPDREGRRVEGGTGRGPRQGERAGPARRAGDPPRARVRAEAGAKRVPVEVTALLDDCRALIDLQARRDGVRVAVTVEAGLPPVYGDPVLLEQVILNLTRNGIDAMAGCPPERRRLEIAASRFGAWVRIAVRDYGSGIDEALAEQVFSPFFTTKSEGMGMGLSICRSIIELHDGRLGFRRLDDGTEFHLQLPRPMIHIVDDEEALRDSLGWLLRSRDLPSRAFASAEAFLAHARSPLAAPNSPGVILLDVRMDGMSGTELFEKLAAEGLCPAWPVLFLTGHGDVPMAVETLKQGAYDFVEKPFNDNSLVDRLTEALAESRRRLAAREETGTREARLASLTDRERAVLELVIEGHYNKVIADRLGIAMRTVEVYRARIFEKMGVKSAVELAALLGSKRGE
ncbi:MAG: response regulator [Betaproteobacteria bacterium]|nr:response regulator [Betaproteobacteria bacterium]